MRHYRLVIINVALSLGAVILFIGAAQAKGPALVKVRIDSKPPGASIYLDGKDGGILGQTGVGDPLRLPKGSHRLFLELEGYKPFEQTVKLTNGQRFMFKLQSEPSRLDIRPPGTNQNSLGAEIFIDGSQVGTVPAKLEVSVGKHIIEVRRSGYVVHTEEVEVRTGETRQLLVALFPEQKAVSPTAPTAPTAPTGSLMVGATLPSAVLVDNQLRGQVPVLVDNLTPGDHVVELQPTDKRFQPWRRSVRVTAGQQGSIAGKFDADPTVPVSVVPRNTNNTYVVTLGQAQSCQTPCMLRALPGRQVISVAGPGSKFFRSEITIPNTPSQVTTQHLTLGKSIAGAILLAYGLPSLISTSVAATDSINAGRAFSNAASASLIAGRNQEAAGYSSQAAGKFLEAAGFGSLAFTGATTAFSAIITLATIKLNRASVEPMGHIAALPRPRVRFLASSIAPTTDRTGAVAGLSFAY